jgi:hypothetical protein
MKLIGSSSAAISFRAIASSSSHGVSDLTVWVGRLAHRDQLHRVIDALPRAIAHEKNLESRFILWRMDASLTRRRRAARRST